MQDRRREDMMLVEEVTADRVRIDPFDIHVRDRTRLIRLERSIESNLRNVLQTIHPVTRQVTQPRLFALAADAVMEEQRLSDREPRRRRVRSDLFKLANVTSLLRLSRHQRPELLDLVALDVKQSGSFRRVEPLVQARPEVIATEILLLKIKLRVRMRSVDDRLDALRAGQVADLFHGCNLAGDVHLVRNEDQFRSTRDSFLERRGDLAEVLGRNRDLHHLQDEAFATFTLVQGRQHARIILRGREYLVARFEIHSHQQDLERLGRVARYGDLFEITVKHFREPVAYDFGR